MPDPNCQREFLCCVAGRCPLAVTFHIPGGAVLQAPARIRHITESFISLVCAGERVRSRQSDNVWPESPSFSCLNAATGSTIPSSELVEHQARLQTHRTQLLQNSSWIFAVLNYATVATIRYPQRAVLGTPSRFESCEDSTSVPQYGGRLVTARSLK